MSRQLFGCFVLLCLCHNLVRGEGEVCEDAIPVDVGERSGTTAGAANDGATVCAAGVSSPDIWYVFEAPRDGRLIASTCGSELDTILSVYSSCPAGKGSEIACNDDDCEDLGSRVSVAAGAGSRYWMRVSGYNGASGPFVLTIEFGDEAPGPDCEELGEIGLNTVIEGRTTTGVNLGSSTCGDQSRRGDVVFRYVATEDCLLVASTCGSDFDTVLSIHSACPPSIPNTLGCNDDACGLQSETFAEAVAGETYFVRVGGYGTETGRFDLELRCEEIPDLTEGPDLKVTGMSQISQVSREDDTVAISMESTLCNTGTASVDWYANPDPRHPFLVFNAYRLLGGRIEQIGQSWVKHGFSASQQGLLCSLPCREDPSGNLGSGCADVYPVSTNADQPTFGPRAEIDPVTGSFLFQDSHIATSSSAHGPLDHRLVIRDADLDPSRNEGARYFAELVVVSAGDADRTNNLGWQQFFIERGSPGGTWRMEFVQTLATNGSILDNWEDATHTVIPGEGAEDSGRCYLGARVTTNDDGSFHYEYALYNFDFSRGVESFSVAVPAGVAIQDAGFYSNPTRDASDVRREWSFSRTEGGVEWSTEPFGGGSNADPLTWGTLYNFWFDSTARPAEVDVALRPFESDEIAEYFGHSIGPAGAQFKRSDANADGITEISDAIGILSFLFVGGEPVACPDAADANDSDDLDLSDAVAILSWLFTGGVAPPAPGPDTCGSDPTPSGLGDCAYAAASCE